MAVQSRNVLTIFIASPGDVSDERKAVKAVAATLNKSYSRHSSWQIDVLGWEDTLPGVGRPQALINRDVEACDVFLGMLWKRWGQPTGKYSSGFEEELEIAKKRRSDGSDPEIWLYFKDVDADQMRDAGPQLQRVLDFKREVHEKREIFCKDFSTIEEFKELVSVGLNSHLLKLSQSAGHKEGAMPVASPPQTTPTPGSAEDGKNISNVLGYVHSCLDHEHLEKVGLFERARLKLFSDALFSDAHSSELLGVHETNLIYRKSSEWTLSDSEMVLLMRAALGDGDDVYPFWRWSGSWSGEKIDEVLASLAIHDGAVKVKVGAIRTLALQNAAMPVEFFERAFGSGEGAVIGASLSLMLANTSNAKSLDLLDSLEGSTDGSTRHAVQDTKAILKFRRHPSDAINYLVSSGIRLPEEIGNALKCGAADVQKDVAFDGLDKAHPTVRRAIAAYLKVRNDLDENAAEKLEADSDAGVRRVGVEWLIEHGRRFSPEELRKLFPVSEPPRGLIGLGMRDEEVVDAGLLVEKSFNACSKTELVGRLDLYSLDAAAAYGALLDKWFDEFVAQARADLDDDFARFQRESDEKFAAKYGLESAKEFRESWKPSTVDYLKAEIRAAIMKRLAVKGGPDDVVFARKVDDRVLWIPGIAEAIVSILGKFGDERDVDVLVRIAGKTFGDNKRSAAQLAARLSSDLNALLWHESVVVRRESLAELARRNKEMAAKCAREYLVSDENDHRRLGVGILIATADRAEIRGILDEYVQLSSYFYNVVAWLDRVLFSPSKYSVGYVRRLREQIGLDLETK